MVNDISQRVGPFMNTMTSSIVKDQYVKKNLPVFYNKLL